MPKKRYRIQIATAPLTSPAGALKECLNDIKGNEKLNSIVPYHDRDGTVLFIVVTEPL